MGILKKVCRTLKDADFAALKASILENRKK
jgi:hypothetical protein